MKHLLKLYILTITGLILMCNTAFADEADFDGYIVKLKSDAVMMCSDDLQAVYAPEGLYKVDTLEEAQALEEYAEYIEPDYTIYLDETYDYSSYETQNSHSDSNSLFMQKIGLYGDNIKIGIVDSGIYPHDALKENIKGGYNYIDSSTDYTDTLGHGTAVASIIGAAYGDFSVIGVAPKCDLYALKCFNEKTGNASDIANAIYGGVNNYDVDLLNLSIGRSSSSQTLKNAIDYATNNGVIVVASAGNNGQAITYYPAAYSNVIGVGALNSTGTTRASFSNYNTHVYCTTIGSNMKVCDITETTYTSKSGTSFSCPFVVGIIANMMILDPDITTEEVMEIFASTCTDMGTAGYDVEYGYGKINAKAIVNYMLRDKDFYISPKDTYFSTTINPVAEYRVWKNPDLETNTIFFWNEYLQNGKLNNLTKYEPTFENGYAVISGSTDTENIIKTFGWYNLTSIRPIPFSYTFDGGGIEDMGDY